MGYKYNPHREEWLSVIEDFREYELWWEGSDFKGGLIDMMIAGCRMSRQHRVIFSKAIAYILLCCLSACFLIPLFWLVTTSIKDDSQIYRVPPQWIPWPPRFDAYPRIFRLMNFQRALFNTLQIVVGTLIGALFSCSLVAYSFARMDWKGRDFWFIMVLATMMLPNAVSMIPIFLVVRRLGWLNTFKPFIIPSFMGNAFYIFLLRQFFLTIPKELSDAARIDGCSDFAILLRIILPLAKSALTVIAIFQFIASWNDFMGPIIYLQDPEKYTLGLALYSLTSGHQGAIDWSGIMAASTIQTLPVLLLFFLAQRYFIEGVTLTGMKG